MKISIYENNDVSLRGRISRIKEYSAGKAANVTITIDNGKDKDGNKRAPIFIQTKCFNPAMYNACQEGMLVNIRGHLDPNSYEKDGEKSYSLDVIADYITFLESKAVVDARAAEKAAQA